MQFLMTILELEQNSTILCDLGSVCMDWSGVVMPFVDLGGYGKKLTPGSPRTFCRLNPCRIDYSSLIYFVVNLYQDLYHNKGQAL